MNTDQAISMDECETEIISVMNRVMITDEREETGTTEID